MILTIHALNAVTERRYKFDEPVVVHLKRMDFDVKVTYFVTITRIYEYGDPEHEYVVQGQPLKKDGTPNQREQFRDFRLFESDKDILEPFIEALWEPTQR